MYISDYDEVLRYLVKYGFFNYTKYSYIRSDNYFISFMWSQDDNNFIQISKFIIKKIILI